MRSMSMAALMLLSISLAAPALAQTAAPIDTRVTKLEKEMRAVQRKVFPGGDSRYFEPEISAPATAAPTAGVPATSPVADLTARVGALESELQRLTGQIEQNGFKMRQLEDGLATLRGVPGFRRNRIENGPNAARAATRPATPSTASAASAVAAATPNVTAPAAPRPATAAPAAAAAAPAAAAPAPAAAAAVAATTADPGEDAYLAGYKLWTEKKYPEAEAALKEVVAKYPKHKRASYAQNLLGRAYLDEGKPALAAEAFYANYQKMPRGERAPDSLYYLGQALVQLKKPADACRVYGELMDVYGATMSVALKDKVIKGRADAKCTAG